MDCVTSTDDLNVEVKTIKDHILLDIIKQICSDTENEISVNLKEKVNRILAECNLSAYSSLHKISTVEDSVSTILGFCRQTNTELTFEEQVELNQAIVHRIQNQIPTFTSELADLKQTMVKNKSQRKQISELEQSLDDKLNTLQEQESEKVELMMEWLNHRLQDVTTFSDKSSEYFSLKTRILELKSKILHLKILQSIFTETNQSIRAYVTIQKDMKESIMQTEQRIKNYNEILRE